MTPDNLSFGRVFAPETTHGFLELLAGYHPRLQNLPCQSGLRFQKVQVRGGDLRRRQIGRLGMCANEAINLAFEERQHRGGHGFPFGRGAGAELHVDRHPLLNTFALLDLDEGSRIVRTRFDDEPGRGTLLPVAALEVLCGKGDQVVSVRVCLDVDAERLADPQVAIEDVDQGTSRGDVALPNDALHDPEIRLVEHRAVHAQQPVQHLGGLVVDRTLQSVAQAFLKLEVEHQTQRRLADGRRRELLTDRGDKSIQLLLRRMVRRSDGLDDAALDKEQQALDQVGDLRAGVVELDGGDDRLHVRLPFTCLGDDY